MGKFIAFSVLSILSVLAIYGQHPNVVVGNSIGWGFPCEPAIKMNPASTNEILVGAVPNLSYTSIDGGYTWSQEMITSPFGVIGDPVILVDLPGRFYYIHLPDTINKIICHRRNGIDSAWTMASVAAFDGIHETDKEWASYDAVNNAIYLTWTYFDEWGSSNPDDSSCIYLSRSDDNGASWSDPVRVSDQKGNASGGNYSTHGSYNATGPNGEVYVSWFSPEGLMFDRSLDKGITWLEQDVNVTGEHINWIYPIPGVYLGVTFPFIACDRSGGPFNGNIYISWSDKRNGGIDADVFLARSTDGGTTWSPPLRVNDDPPGHHQFFPALTVDQVTGKVWILFFDRRNYTDQNTDVYMAVSEDGGESFMNFRVSETPFLPFNSVFFGHYLDVAAHDDQVFAVWNRMDNGEATLMGALVNPSIIGTDENQSIPKARLENYPNPCTESSFVSFRLEERSIITLQLFDVTGKIVSTIIESEKFPRGKHVKKIDAIRLGISPGAYIIKLSADRETLFSKMLMVGE